MNEDRTLGFPQNPYPPGRHHYALSLVPPLPTSPTILDYGCWDGAFIHSVSRMVPGSRAIGCDVDGDAIARAVELHGDTVTFFTVEPGAQPLLPLDDGSVSIAFLCDVLEHLGDGLETAVVAELARVLCPGGILIVTVPHRGALAWADPENFKFRWPTAHRRVFTWLHGAETYAGRYGDAAGRFGNFSPAPDGTAVTLCPSSRCCSLVTDSRSRRHATTGSSPLSSSLRCRSPRESQLDRAAVCVG